MSSLPKNNIFQGIKYLSSLQRYLSNEIKIEGLSLQRVVLSKITVNFNNKENFSFSTIKEIFYLFYRTLFHRMIYKEIYSGKDEFWFFTDKNIRKTYLNEIENIKRSALPPTIMSYDLSPRFLAPNRVVIRLLQLLELSLELKDTHSNLLMALTLGETALYALDLKEDFKNYKITTLLSFKDFSELNCATVQIANLSGVATFTTQHSVHHQFNKRNYRCGNIIFFNRVAKNVLLWGDAIHSSYSDLSNGSSLKLIPSKAIFRPKLEPRKLSENKLLLVCLGGRRHQQENLKILEIAIQATKQKNYSLCLRPHPTIDITIYTQFLNKYGVGQESLINIPSTELPTNTICLTGLSGAYYDFLYLGLKVIFYEHPYDLAFKLPRMGPLVKNATHFLATLGQLENQDNDQWVTEANQICLSALGLKINEQREESISDEVWRLRDC